MKNKILTVVIRTINRITLPNAINSALEEIGNVIVVADCVDLNLSALPKNVEYYKLNKKFDKFCSAGINVGAFLCKTPYFCLLDDDDEFIDGAGRLMIDKIIKNPEIDIWIPGLLYNNGSTACKDGSLGVNPGNIAVPTYKTDLLFKVPFSSSIVPKNSNGHHIDFFHIKNLYDAGYKVDWYNSLLYRIRPNLVGMHGTYNPDNLI